MLGKQGAGKGTQCVRLSRHYVVPHISTGDMLRGAVRSRSELGIEAKSHMDAGDLIPDSIVIGLVAERLGHTDTANRGFVLDGFPRTVAQAVALAELMSPRGLDLVVDLEVETEVVLKRLASRRVCTDCGTNYSVNQTPKVDGVCDVCGGEVVQREDDTEAAIRRRLELYERETAPLIAWYRDQGILASIDGMGTADEVAARLVRVVEDSRARGLAESARQPAPVATVTGVESSAATQAAGREAAPPQIREVRDGRSSDDGRSGGDGRSSGDGRPDGDGRATSGVGGRIGATGRRRQGNGFNAGSGAGEAQR